METVVILIPAAGSSSRMEGRDKLLEEIDGEPLLVRTVRRGLAADCTVMVTLSSDHPRRVSALEGLDHPALQRIGPFDATEGMAVSIRKAAETVLAQWPPPGGLMIMLADMPDITTEDLKALLAAFRRQPDLVHRATTADGQPGHPVIFPARLLPRLAELKGDEGARQVLTGEKVVAVALPGNHAITDLDTPEDWAAWHAANGQ